MDTIASAMVEILRIFSFVTDFVAAKKEIVANIHGNNQADKPKGQIKNGPNQLRFRLIAEMNRSGVRNGNWKDCNQ